MLTLTEMLTTSQNDLVDSINPLRPNYIMHKISSGFLLSKCLEKFSKHHSSSTCLLIAFFSSCLLYCIAMSQDEIRSTLGLKGLKANYQIHLH